MSITAQVDKLTFTKRYPTVSDIETMDVRVLDNGGGPFVELKTKCFTIETETDLKMLVKTIRGLLNIQ